ncbi:carbohydrate ABC transporter permease [Paenibacillus rhizophilus]|uniref:Sugar ABC transporter permease n=1 Tax=Paenibacillus rhizophilus TaxID=1850366 RepID=A0A3N9P754_9BACL|nr:sugar ABC transporter permease [Paenibacillus rhizophilus]RQW12073.1 sugar ABC transporter permease [Paenibacillus rhizophilus]
MRQALSGKLSGVAVRPAVKRTSLRKQLIYFAFVSPALLLFTLIIVLPFFRAILFSFQDWDGISSNIEWAGWDNYITLFHDKAFLKSFLFTLKYVAVGTVLVNIAGFFLAFAMNFALKSKNVLRTVYFMPHVIGPLIIGFIWQFIFTQVFPNLADLTGWGVFQKSWLALPNYAFWALIIVNVWYTAGYLMVIYIAALQGVSPDLLEAAEIDGANSWQRLWFMVLPLVRPAITICLFLAITNGFKVFDLNFALTKGGPFGSTESLALQIYQDAFSNNQYTLASTKAIVFFVVLASITLIQVFVMKRKEVEM